MTTLRALIVLPTYQEAANITDVLGRIRAAAPDVGVLVIDDGSPDGTAKLAEEAAGELGDVWVLSRASKMGLGSAYRDGFRWGMERAVDILVEMDADLSHDPGVVPALLDRIDDGADLVIGSRYIEGGATPDWTPFRRALSRWGNRYAARALRLGVADATSGFRAFRAEALRRIRFDTARADGYGFQIETVYRAERAGLRVDEVPICFMDRAKGRSKMSSWIVVEALALTTLWGARDRLLRRGRRARAGEVELPTAGPSDVAPKNAPP